MAVLTTTVVGVAGVAPNLVAAAAGGDRCEVGKTVFLHVKNASGGSLTVTIDSVAPSNYGVDNDLAVAAPAGQERFIGPLPPERFASASDGLAAITYSGVTSLTVEPVRV